MPKQSAFINNNPTTVLWVVWGGMFFSLFIYGAVGFMLAAGNEAELTILPENSVTLIKNLLLAISIGSLPLVYLLRKMMLKKFSVVKLKRSAAVQRYLIIVVISLAASESIGIFGLLLFFFTADFKLLYAFLALSAAAMLFHRPKAGELENLIQDPQD